MKRKELKILGLSYSQTQVGSYVFYQKKEADEKCLS